MSAKKCDEMEVFVSKIDYWYDDYKRAEAHSEITGVYRSYQTAWSNCLKTEYEKNIELNDDYEDSKQFDEYNKCMDKLNDIMSQKLILTDSEFEDFISDWSDARSDALGSGEFTMNPTSYTGSVEKIKLE